MRALLVAAGGAVDVESRLRYLADGAHDRLEPLRRRGAAEDDRAQLVAGGMRAALEPGEVDPVAERDELRRLEGKRARVDAEHVRRRSRRRAEERARAPVREPEQDGHPERAGKRSGQHRVDRAHVGEHGVGAAQLRGERAREAEAARRLAPAAERLDAAVRGSEPGTAPSERTTSSSTCAASARSLATVAPRTGSAGSTCWVTKMSFKTRRSRRAGTARGRRGCLPDAASWRGRGSASASGRSRPRGRRHAARAGRARSSASPSLSRAAVA